MSCTFTISHPIYSASREVFTPVHLFLLLTRLQHLFSDFVIQTVPLQRRLQALLLVSLMHQSSQSILLFCLLYLSFPLQQHSLFLNILTCLSLGNTDYSRKFLPFLQQSLLCTQFLFFEKKHTICYRPFFQLNFSALTSLVLQFMPLSDEFLGEAWEFAFLVYGLHNNYIQHNWLRYIYGESSQQLVQSSPQLLEQLQLLVLVILLRIQLSCLLLQSRAKKRGKLVNCFASEKVERRGCLFGSNVKDFLNSCRSTCFVRKTPIYPSTWVALRRPLTRFSSILKRFWSTRRYPNFLSYSSYGQSAGGHSGRQYHHLTATSFTNFSFGSSSSTLTRSAFCLGCLTSSLSSTLRSLFGFFYCLRFERDYDSSDSDSSSDSSYYDSSLSLTCLRLYDSSLALNSGYVFLIFFSTRLKLSPQSESSSSIVSGFSYFCCCYNLRLAYSSALRASSSFLLRFSYFLCLISSRRACSSASSLASSSLSKLSLFVLRLLTTTCVRTHLPLPNRSSPISDSNSIIKNIAHPRPKNTPSYRKIYKKNNPKVDPLQKQLIVTLYIPFNFESIIQILSIVMSSVNADCLLTIKQCSNTAALSEQQIRTAFKQYAIGRIAKFEERDEIVIEFTSQEELELLDMEFQEGKVPLLGPNAYYDVQSAADPQEFLERYERSTIKSQPETTTKDHLEIEKFESQAEEQQRKEQEMLKLEQERKKIEQEKIQSEEKLRRQLQEEQRAQKEQEERIRKEKEQKERQELERLERAKQRLWVQRQKKEAEERERQLKRKEQEERQKEAQLQLHAEQVRKKFEQEMIKIKIQKEKQEYEAKILQQQRRKQEQEQKLKKMQAQAEEKRRLQLEGIKIQSQKQMAAAEQRLKKQQEELRLAQERRLREIEQEKKKAEAKLKEIAQKQLREEEQRRKKEYEEAQRRLREAQQQEQKRKIAELQRITYEEEKKRLEVQELKQKEHQILRQKEFEEKQRREKEELKRMELEELQKKKIEMQVELQNFQQIQEKLEKLKKPIQQKFPQTQQKKSTSSMVSASFMTIILAGWLYYIFLR